MSHRVPILDDGWALIADENEITVRERNAIRDAVLDAQSAKYAISVGTKAKIVELEGLRTPDERAYEKRLTAAQKKGADDDREGTAALLAFRGLSKEEQYNFNAHERVRIRCYLRGWHLDKDIPVTDDDFDDLPEVLFEALFKACDQELPAEPDLSDSPDSKIDPKVQDASSES